MLHVNSYRSNLGNISIITESATGEHCSGFLKWVCHVPHELQWRSLKGPFPCHLNRDGAFSLWSTVQKRNHKIKQTVVQEKGQQERVTGLPFTFWLILYSPSISLAVIHASCTQQSCHKQRWMATQKRDREGGNQHQRVPGSLDSRRVALRQFYSFTFPLKGVSYLSTNFFFTSKTKTSWRRADI